MKPESPSSYPQVPATCPYPEPTPSSPHDPLQLPEDPALLLQNFTAAKSHIVFWTHTAARTSVRPPNFGHNYRRATQPQQLIERLLMTHRSERILWSCSRPPMNAICSTASKLRPSLWGTAIRVLSHLFKVISRGRCFAGPSSSLNMHGGWRLEIIDSWWVLFWCCARFLFSH